MGVQVSFNYTTWCAQFPALVPYINAVQAAACFSQAILFQANDGSGPINDPDMALSLLNLMVAHIATLTYPTTGPATNPDPASPLVGRVSNATEGSVSVAAQNDYPPGSPQWYQTTKFGSMWWEATAQFRTIRYLPSRIARGPYGPWGFRLGYGG